MSGYKPYPKYKDSGIEWLGEIPETWEIKKLGRLCSRIGSGKTPTGGAEIYTDSGIIFLRSQNIHDDGMDLSDVAYITAEIDSDMAWSRVLAGDILINITGASIGRTCLVPDKFSPANVNQHVCAIRLSNPSAQQFVSVQLKSHYFKRVIEAIQDGGNRDSLNYEQISGFKVLIAPQTEMDSIAAFLDCETRKLDLLIREQKELIALLQEKRQALISNAVTKGLNPKAKMKDSGVEWLGEVPEHWDVKKLGLLCSRIGSGKTPTGGAEIYSDSGVIFIRSQNVHDSGMDLSDVAFISQEIDKSMAWSRVKAGDILLNITGASIGRTCLVPDDFDAANVNQHVCVIRLLDQDSRGFISAQLKSYYFKRLIEAIQDGGNRDSLNFEQISGFKVLIAPKHEMSAIITYLSQSLGKLDRLIQEAEETIELMHEHRASLISEAVTGKIDVRDLV